MNISGQNAFIKLKNAKLKLALTSQMELFSVSLHL